MLNQHFYHGQIKKYTTVFGSLFSNIKIVREADTNNDEKTDSTQTIKVPLRYAAAAKYSEPDSSQSVGVIVPAMSFELVNLEYDSTRKENSANQIMHSIPFTNADNIKKRNYQFQRVPYNFYYQLKARTKNITDMAQIVEQILPFFDPYLSVTIDDQQQSELDVKQDIHISLNSVDPGDNWEGDMNESRLIEWSLDFTLKGYLYKNTLSGGVIERIVVTVPADQACTQLIVAGVSSNGSENNIMEFTADLYDAMNDIAGTDYDTDQQTWPRVEE